VLSDQTVLGSDLVLMQMDPVLNAFRHGEIALKERDQVEAIIRPAPQARAAMKRALHKRRRELDELLKQEPGTPSPTSLPRCGRRSSRPYGGSALQRVDVRTRTRRQSIFRLC
jgi:hypothetical protein